MYKKWIFFMCILFLWTGCGSKEKELQLEKINTELQALTLDTLDYDSFDTVLEDINSFTIYNQEELNAIGLDVSLYENIFFCESKENTQRIIVIEPKKNKKQEIEDFMKKYFDHLIQNTTTEEDKNKYDTRVEQSYGNHLIYIAGFDNDSILDQIKETKTKLFKDMIPLKKTDVETKLDISFESIDGYLFVVRDKLDQTIQYLIIKTKDSTNVRQKIHNYFENLENSWEKKDSKQYELLKNRMEKQLGDYLIYIVSEDNKMAFQTIESYYK